MPTHKTLAEVELLAGELRQHFVAPMELPEPSTRLGLSERAGQPVRQFKHLHQMCLGHVENLALSSQIKLLALLDGYIDCATKGATLGLYLFARTIVEQCAFANEVRRRLLEVSNKPAGNWMPKGEEFFGLAVRFRFATGNKELQKQLEALGFPQKLLKPVNVMNCVASLLANPSTAELAPFYDKLCDFVHHNGPSHYTASSGYFVGSAAVHHSSGGAVLTKTPGPISRYEYPAANKAQTALDDTVQGVSLAARECLKLTSETPRSPFPTSQIKEMTGNELGMVFVGNARSMST
ncbi:MAG TPA: hypothetical protein VHM00_08335 [Caldimonas sp.]|jgi:hypothetical protein|nr:hypothetical protein [Caldimonas sp.]HEX2541077.1 hypothetical protein [Caldimonas sp.]